MDYIRVVLKDLPVTVRGFTVSDDFDFYTIYINSRLSNQMQIETYEHELSHINNGDFIRMQSLYNDTSCDTDVNKIESERHK